MHTPPDPWCSTTTELEYKHVIAEGPASPTLPEFSEEESKSQNSRDTHQHRTATLQMSLKRAEQCCLLLSNGVEKQKTKQRETLSLTLDLRFVFKPGSHQTEQASSWAGKRTPSSLCTIPTWMAAIFW